MPDPNEQQQEQGQEQEQNQQGQEQQEQQQEQTFSIKVGGEDRTCTLEELKNLAQESAGAQEKFRQASEIRKEAETGIRISQLMESMNSNPNDQDARELATLLGLDPGELMDEINASKDEQNTSAGAKGTQKPTELSAEQLSKAMTDMFGMTPEQIAAQLNYSKTRHVNDARKDIRNQTDNAVDKDDVFGKIMIGEAKDSRSEVLKEMVFEDVLRRIQDGEQFGANMISSSIQKVRSRVTKFGIPNHSHQDPITLGLGPGSGLPAEVLSEKTIERVPADSDGYINNAVSRLMQRQIAAKRQ